MSIQDTCEYACESSRNGIINENKPGKGNFIIRANCREECIVELVGLKIPFPSLKKLNMDELFKEMYGFLRRARLSG